MAWDCSVLGADTSHLPSSQGTQSGCQKRQLGKTWREFARLHLDSYHVKRHCPTHKVSEVCWVTDPVVAIDCRNVKRTCVALLVEVGKERDLSGHRSCTLKGCRSGAEDCRDARLAECKGPARGMRIGHLFQI